MNEPIHILSMTQYRFAKYGRAVGEWRDTMKEAIMDALMMGGTGAADEIEMRTKPK